MPDGGVDHASGEVARIRFRFSYKGKDTHPPTHQELPAVFVDHALADLVYYNGVEPWTDKPISKDVPGWPNESRKTAENWAGFVGPDERGVGVLFPGTDTITTYRHPGPDGPKGGGCSYFAPIRTMSITPGWSSNTTSTSPSARRRKCGRASSRSPGSISKRPPFPPVK